MGPESLAAHLHDVIVHTNWIDCTHIVYIFRILSSPNVRQSTNRRLPPCVGWTGAQAEADRYNAGVKMRSWRPWNMAIQAVFFLLVLAVFMSKAASANFSHDENQFIAPGQLLAYHGLLPYVDYPYTHMPYATLFYGIGAAITPYDFLVGRMLNAVAWFVCALLIVMGFRRMTSMDDSAPPLFLDIVVICIFVFNTILAHIAGNALNHSLASLFSLLALAFFVRKNATPAAATRGAFGAGALAGLAAWTRFNYAVLLPVLGCLYVVEAWRSPPPRRFRSVIAYAAGALTGSIPVLGLFVAAPQPFMYGNYLYIRLNTIYYSGLLTRVNMQLGQKLLDFLSYVIASPLDLVLYLAMLFMLVRSVVRYARTASAEALSELALAGCALALAVTAFAPTPTQPQYFLAPIPVLCVCLLVLGRQVYQAHRVLISTLGTACLVAVFAASSSRATLASLGKLADPSAWVPIEAHQFATRLHQYVPSGRILTLLPMFPLEVGYDVYPFAATGPFSWRTSLLLTAERRALYGVTSPEELGGLLNAYPPQAVLTGFESTNAGFDFGDLGGLERPLTVYAEGHRFSKVPLPAPFLEQAILLWVRKP